MRNAKRKLVTGVLASVALAAGVGWTALPASADQRTLRVTLADGTSLFAVVDLPAGTPVDQITIPGASAPIARVEEVPPGTATGTPVQAQPLAPAPPAPATPPAPPATATTPPPPPASTTTTPAAPGPTSTVPGPVVAPEPADPERRGGDADGADRDRRDGAKDEKDEKARKRSRARGKGKRPASPVPGTAPATPVDPLAFPEPLGIPNLFIERFRIPPFLLPIYQAAGTEYGVRWEVLAAINEIETDYGRNLNVSTAGAVGWMQFLPSTWETYGVDANGDRKRDPYNPVDAIFAAARYLKAAGAEQDIRAALWAYNHADWYVESVILRARFIGSLPADFVGSLTGLTQGRFPVHGRASYAGAIEPGKAAKRVRRGANAAAPVEAAPGRRSLAIRAKPGTPVIAVQDGEVIRMGQHPRLGTFLQLRDAYGNTYSYGHLGELAERHPVPKPRRVAEERVEQERATPARDPKPTAAASAGKQVDAAAPAEAEAPPAPPREKQRLFANPTRPQAFSAGGRDQLGRPAVTTFRSYFTQVYGLKRDDVVLRDLEPGSKVVAGTILGRVGDVDATRPHVRFEVRPAGRGAPRIDPKPVLDGWRLLESTSIYRATAKGTLASRSGDDPSIGQLLLMSKEALTRQVLDDPRVRLYECGRRDIRAGIVDRRVLATLAFLAASKLEPTVTSLRCGHSYLTKSGNVSHHSSGDAVDIAAINGTPVMGHQGPGSVTDQAVRRLLALQGAMVPDQIITLMTYPNTRNTLAMADHDDHIHVGFRPLFGKAAQRFASVLKPEQWTALVDRLGEIDNPSVPLRPSRYALPTPRSAAGAGE